MNKKNPLPRLGTFGFGSKGSIDPTQVELCKKWLKKHARQRKTINPRLGSYFLKRLVEYECGTHVATGAFIQAALDLGYNVKPFGPNAGFNISLTRAFLRSL